MTHTIEPPADEVTIAERDEAEAQQLLAALEEAVLDGDIMITPQQLTEQRELSRFARLRAEAARRKVERFAAEAAERKRARTVARAVRLVDNAADPATVAAAYDNARAAIAALLGIVKAHDDAIAEAAHLLRQADAPAITRFASDPAADVETAPACRTAPTVEPQHATLSIETGTYRAAIGTGPALVALLDEITQAYDVSMPPGSAAFMQAPMSEHAYRHTYPVRRLLDLASTQAEGSTK
ncbi:hypothetical protein ACIQZO_26320 [Streptomyces sp. NPDC097617]|uniref:hypothetical protein n=1 Tax=Streptomyces sp. NPDC097617 TaxID=3366091 RepID=UPI00381E0FFE